MFLNLLRRWPAAPNSPSNPHVLPVRSGSQIEFVLQAAVLATVQEHLQMVHFLQKKEPES